MLIEDADRNCMFFEPEPDNFSTYWKLIQEGQRRLGGDPNVGRRLATCAAAALLYVHYGVWSFIVPPVLGVISLLLRLAEPRA